MGNSASSNSGDTGRGTQASFAENTAGEMVHVSEVPRGLKANVCCPDCNGRMIARQGKERRWHFAHYKSVSCGGMTWLHRTAQSVLVDQRRITLPDYGQAIGEKRLGFSEVREEAAVDSRRVDCLCVMEDGYEIAVEIKVTHEVDDEKLVDLRSADPHRDIVEIDLMSLRSSATSRQELVEAVCDSSQYVRWLYKAEPRPQSDGTVAESNAERKLARAKLLRVLGLLESWNPSGRHSSRSRFRRPQRRLPRSRKRYWGYGRKG